MRIIAGRWRGHRIKAPKGRSVRPTTDRVREAWMSALGAGVQDARVLDLFAGSGALGLEALSRGAREVVFVERARSSLKILRDNIETLGAGDECRIVKADALNWIDRPERGRFDLVLADPPYERGWAARLAERFLQDPFASELWLEHRTGEELPEAPGRRDRGYGDTTLTTYVDS